MTWGGGSCLFYICYMYLHIYLICIFKSQGNILKEKEVNNPGVYKVKKKKKGSSPPLLQLHSFFF